MCHANTSVFDCLFRVATLTHTAGVCPAESDADGQKQDELRGHVEGSPKGGQSDQRTVYRRRGVSAGRLVEESCVEVLNVHLYK